MTELGIDIETYSSVDLKACGVYKYVESPDFEILLLGFAFDDGPVTVMDLHNGSGDRAAFQKFEKALYDPTVIKTAHNAQFERVCLSHHFGKPIPPEQMRCTAVLAAQLGLPRALEEVGRVMGLPEDERKLTTGKALIRYFCKPCTPTRANGGRTRNLPQHDPAKWQLFKEYNAGDVTAERAIRDRLRTYSPDKTEQRLWELDQRINDHGVQIDEPMVEHAIAAAAEIEERTTAEVLRLTGITKAKSGQQLKAWLNRTDEELGVTSLTKKTVPEYIKATGDATVKRVLELRTELSKASVKKYEALDRATNKDGRLRCTLLFYGGHTGRWAGRIFQPQNLPQNHMAFDELALARDLLKAGEYAGIEMLYGSLPDTLSQLIRTALIPKPGHKFIVADYSAIEARVIAWYAQEEWRMEVFRTTGKIYEASAEQMFKLPKGSINKHTPEGAALRQKGKVAELALGYGGAAGALIAMGALEKGLSEEELPGIVRRWRMASPAITAFWWAVGDAAIKAVKTGRATQTHGLTFTREDGFLFIRLPSGRKLAYVRPHVERKGAKGEQLIYEGVEGTKRTWGQLETYGPRLVENIVQATARDLLAHGMQNLEAHGYPVCFHVHDEAIAETPIGTGSLAEMVQLLTALPEWADGLPIRADGFETDAFYRKE